MEAIGVILEFGAEHGIWLVIALLLGLGNVLQWRREGAIRDRHATKYEALLERSNLTLGEANELLRSGIREIRRANQRAAVDAEIERRSHGGSGSGGG